MNKLHSLIETIKHEGKMNDSQIISWLSDAISKGTDEKEIYTNMYIEAFGYNITKEIAEDLVHKMPETGEHFTMQEAKEYESRVGLNTTDVPVCEFYLVMNNMYSDYHNTISKYCNDSMIYAELTKDWFNDADADVNKTFYYFMMN